MIPANNIKLVEKYLRVSTPEIDLDRGKTVEEKEEKKRKRIVCKVKYPGMIFCQGDILAWPWSIEDIDAAVYSYGCCILHIYTFITYTYIYSIYRYIMFGIKVRLVCCWMCQASVPSRAIKPLSTMGFMLCSGLAVATKPMEYLSSPLSNSTWTLNIGETFNPAPLSLSLSLSLSLFSVYHYPSLHSTPAYFSLSLSPWSLPCWL